MTRKAPYPKHINPDKVPTGCYWQAHGKGRWITTWRENGRKRSKTLAGPNATLADLHAAMEAHKGKSRGTLAYLVEKFEDSSDYAHLSPATRRD